MRILTDEEVLQTFRDTKALLSGHFELRSKLHSDQYFQCALVLQYPRIDALCYSIHDFRSVTELSVDDDDIEFLGTITD